MSKISVRETRLVVPPEGFDDDQYAYWLLKYHDNDWVLLAIRPDGVHIFGKFHDF